MFRITSRRHVLRAASTMAALAALPPHRARAAGVLPIRIANASGTLELAMGALMRRQRYLERFGLEPEVMGVADGTRILGALVGGSVDASMMSGFGQVFPAVAHGAPLKILAGGALLPMLALYSGRADVRTLRDLEGRIVGTGSIGALVYQLTVLLLRKYGVDVSKVRFVSIGSSADIFRAVAAGTVDAGAGEASLMSEAAAHRVHLVEHGNMTVELKEYTFQGAWTSDRAIADKRDTLVRALAAYAQLYRFVQTPAARGPFLDACRSVLPSTPASELQAQWRYIQEYKPFAVDLTLSPERLHYMQAVNVGFGVQSAILPFEQVADMSLAADALKLLAATPA
jgi:NitT/TauT family transport system substrate-binding protein